MLRDRSGMTSWDEIFWLMPAMRRNERSGPGMLISDPGESEGRGAAFADGRSEKTPRDRNATRRATARKETLTTGDLVRPGNQQIGRTYLTVRATPANPKCLSGSRKRLRSAIFDKR